MGILPSRVKTTLMVFFKGIPMSMASHFPKATSTNSNLKEKKENFKQDNITYLCRDTPISLGYKVVDTCCMNTIDK
jgi:hypothetical protein